MKAMQFPVALDGLDTLSDPQLSSGRWCFKLAGIPGWCWEYPHGLCMALRLDPPCVDERWLLRACLWLASVKEALDDSIISQEGQYFLVRRYPLGCERAVLEAGSVQHLSVARWLSAYEENETHATVASLAGRWA
jgi:hypothetical protein